MNTQENTLTSQARVGCSICDRATRVDEVSNDKIETETPCDAHKI